VEEKVLHTFEGADGKNPSAGLIFDSAGNLYGTTWDGGRGNCLYGGCGVVFRLAPACCGRWKQKVLYSFTGGADGGAPAAGLTFDAKENIYGTTVNGGESDVGAVFELARDGQGKWREKVLHSFSGTDGADPFAGAIFGPSGGLYGTTLNGGSPNCYGGCGVAFELRPGADGGWTEKTLYEFCSDYDCSDGYALYTGLIVDAAGNLYGATFLGGAFDDGTVFELTPSGNSLWTEAVVYNFGGSDGACTSGTNPAGNLIFDADGKIYGTTWAGGTSCGDAGVAFKVALPLSFGITGD
jgi:uncharacterized repeat protein (TIGR03803 family)